MPDERRTRHEANLNQFWNALVQGTSGGSADAGDLDPDTAQVLRELQVLGSAAAPTASRERVRTRVLAEIQASPTLSCGNSQSNCQGSPAVRAPNCGPRVGLFSVSAVDLPE